MRPLLLMFCALTGAASIVYEVTWTHDLTLTVGGSGPALAVVLATFLTGMALGAAFAGRRERLRPLLLCAALEVVLGLFGLGWPFFGPKLPLVVAGLASLGLPVTVASFLVAGLALFFPTFLMGATFPLWVRGVMNSVADAPRAAARVYAVQVLGGAAGAFLAGYVLIPEYGHALTSRVAGSVDLAIGSLLFLPVFSRRLISEGAPSGAREPMARTHAVAFLLAGFAALGYQVVWTRALVFFLDGIHYAFAAVLTAVLSGLGLGGALVSVGTRWTKNPSRWLAFSQGIAAVVGLSTLWLVPLLGEPATAAAGLADGYRGRLLLLAIASLTLPATILGTTLPLATWISLLSRDAVGRSLSRAYAFTTVGNALGALAVALLFIPFFSLRSSWALLAVLNGGAAFLLARRAFWRGVTGALMLLAVGAVVLTSVRPEPLILASHVFRGNREVDRTLEEYEDGASCAVSVVRDHRRGVTSLYTDTFAAAATGRDNGYMRLLGHVPVLLCERPERALVVCFGTGTTARAVASHPEVKSLRVVDLERRVFQMAHRFEGVAQMLEDPRVETVVRDGRLDLTVEEGPYDVITLEPLLPHTQGAASFYTREFHELVRTRLAPGGTYCHWIPVHVLPLDTYRALVRTFLDVFPNGSVFFYEQSSILFARRDGPVPSWESFAARAARERVAEDLRFAYVGGPHDLLAARVATGPELRAVLADREPMVDDHPTVAYLERRPESQGFVPLVKTLGFMGALSAIECAARPESPLLGLLADAEAVDRKRIITLRDLRRGLLEARLVDTAWRAGIEIPPRPDARGMDPVLGILDALKNAAPEHLERLALERRREGVLASAHGRARLNDGEPASALALVEGRDAPIPEWFGLRMVEAMALLVLGDSREAEVVLEKILARNPRDVDGLALRSVAATESGDAARGRGSRVAAEKLDRKRATASIESLTRLRERFVSTGNEGVGAVRAALLTPRELTLKNVSHFVHWLGARAALSAQLRAPSVRRLTAGVREEDALLVLRRLGFLGVEPKDASLLHSFLEVPGPTGLAAARALAATAPADEKLFARLRESADLETRRLLAWSSGERASPGIVARWVVPLLADEDSDVRLFADRALRGLTGTSVGFNYAGSLDDRIAAQRRWEAAVDR